MPDVGMSCDGRQGALRACAADEDRQRAYRRRIERGKPVLDADQTLVEQVEPGPEGAEVVSVSGVVLFVPSCAEAEDQPASADVIDGTGHVGEQVRVAVTDTGDEQPDVGV